jgi:hypothetical protein
LLLPLFEGNLVTYSVVKQKEKHLQRTPEECLKKHYIMSPAHIHILRFILEAYEGLGLITTLDPDLGLIELSLAPGCEEDLAQILSAEKDDLLLRQVCLEPL